jgi:cytochrome bd-type quinol oxidase subunit 2
LEADHVWLILIVVILFTCVPAAFSTIMIDLNIPLTLMLLAIVLRGAAFGFRTMVPVMRSRTADGAGSSGKLASLHLLCWAWS